MAERYIVTSALPYVNNIPHLGNLIGSVLPADVYSRWLRMKGKEVIYICGTDEHGTPITVSARKEGVTPRELADKYYTIIKDCFERFDIKFDNFSRTTKPVHYKMTTRFFTKLHDNGFIHKEDMNLPFCPTCEHFLPDRYVEGICPNCGAEGARGDQCDACQTVHDPEDLEEPYCVTCHTTPEWKITAHWFLDLPKLAPELKTWLEAKTDWPSNARNFPLGWIKKGLKPRAITRDLEWGVPVPLEGAEGKVIYVWFDAPIGYISSTIEWSENEGRTDEWKKYWYNDEAKLIHFLGKDNVPFHTIIWPGMLIGMREDFTLPHYIASFEYLNYEGQKFSKSRGVGIWIDQALDMYPVDYWRYALVANAPQTRDTDFSMAELKRRINDELADIMGNFVHRTLTFTHRFFGGKVPERGPLADADLELLAAIEKARQKIDARMDVYDLKGALHEVIMLAKEGNRYFNDREPWKVMKTDPVAAGTTLNLCAQIVGALAVVSSPFIPRSAQLMWEAVGSEGLVEEQAWDASAGVEAGTVVPEPTPLFVKIEDEEKKKKAAKPKSVAKEKKKKEGGKPMITFDEFEKIDLRVAVIKTAEQVEGTKKLLKLTVDVGEEEPRTLVAGIADQYKAEDLPGRRIVVLVNLKPAKIRGITSNGMLLAAEVGEDVGLLTIDKELDAGAKVL